MASVRRSDPHRRKDELPEQGLTESPSWVDLGTSRARHAEVGFHWERDGRALAELFHSTVLLAGVWLAVAPFVLTGMIIGDAWGDVLLGLTLSALALRCRLVPRKTPWPGIVIVLIGIWLVAVPFLPLKWPGVFAVNDIIVGVIVALAATGSAGWTLHVGRSARPPAALGRTPTRREKE